MDLITPDEYRVLRAKWFRQPFAFRPYLRMLLGLGLASMAAAALAGL